MAKHHVVIAKEILKKSFPLFQSLLQSLQFCLVLPRQYKTIMTFFPVDNKSFGRFFDDDNNNTLD